MWENVILFGLSIYVFSMGVMAAFEGDEEGSIVLVLGGVLLLGVAITSLL